MAGQAIIAIVVTISIARSAPLSSKLHVAFPIGLESAGGERKRDAMRHKVQGVSADFPGTTE